MDDAGKAQKNFVGYEYKEVAAEGHMVSFLLDGYACFGWEVDENLSGNHTEVIHLKRNRKLVNKAELTRLQRNFEACVSEIETLEKSKTSLATMSALVLGVLGTAFIAGSVFAVTAQPPRIVLCILLAVPGFLGWIFPYFVYKKVGQKQTRRLMPLIEEKYDEIYEICEKGNRLLH